MSFWRTQHRTVYQGTSKTGRDTVRIIPLGGTGNVTKNMFVYEYRVDGKIRDILIVDCGIGFPDPEMYGVDVVIPDVRYLENKKQYIRGLVFTHGHDDHIGGIPYVYGKLGNIPMWGTTLTAAFVNIKLREIKLPTRVTAVDFDKTLTIGAFTVSFARVTHSVPDAANLIIETPIGIFYHGSDFKFDFDPLDGKLSELGKITATGKRGILCLLSDSLGSERPGFTPSEQVVGETIEKELKLATGKVLFTTQSSNISRIQRAIELAIAYGRSVAFLGRSIDQNVEESVKLGYMKFPREALVRDRDLKRVPPTKQFLVVAGSQGQDDSALSRIAHDNHRFVTLDEGDTVIISADPIPGREHDVNNLIDQIYRKGARVSYSDIMEDLHVSGHGSQGDMMLLLSAIGPRYVLPIGGTYKHLMQYRRLAQDLGYDKKDVLIPEEGQVLEFSPYNAPHVVETVELENVMVDGLGVGDVGNVVLRDRQTIATEGIVVVVIPIQKSTGRVTGSPDIVSRGFVYMKDSGKLLDDARHVILQSLRLKKGRMFDWQFARKQISENLSALLVKETGRRPLIVPVIVEV
ncbi:MAG: ribonuclease J [Candidatus Gottesmanbacteria bacterium]|nr:ribonuclease J [Candidatus Gottesmanbacteria bacterium]